MRLSSLVELACLIAKRRDDNNYYFVYNQVSDNPPKKKKKNLEKKEFSFWKRKRKKKKKKKNTSLSRASIYHFPFYEGARQCINELSSGRVLHRGGKELYF